MYKLIFMRMMTCYQSNTLIDYAINADSVSSTIRLNRNNTYAMKVRIT